MRILIPVFSPATGTWGGLTCVVAVAEDAQRAGHQVAFCASGFLFSRLKTRGYQVYPAPAATMFSLPEPFSCLLEKRSQGVELPVKPRRDFGNIWFVLFLSGMASSKFLKQLVKAEQSAARDFTPDFVFTDLDPGAFLLSRIEGLSIAAAYQTPMTQGIGTLPWRMTSRGIRSILKSHQLPLETVSVLTQVFKPEGKFICLVGVQSLRVVRRIGAVELRPNIRAADALPYCDWTICYGGQNTIIQSLLNCVP